ncbi:MAG: ATP-binding cassette domain-containing protein [Parachlamydia sp.]|jgi:ATPase subunit of ABC transporter with duplicated ATPase domains|nr:ATP-binding cassette domain-containing protein [Parachlamydia sp.]
MINILELTMRFGAKILFKEVSLQFNQGNRYGLLGANGSGKSTFLKLLTKELTPDGGDIAIAQNLGVGSLKQDHYLYEEEEIISIVIRGKNKLWQAFEDKKALLNEPHIDCERLEKCEKIIEQESGYAAESEAAKLLEGLGIQEAFHKKPLKVLSGGYKLRVLLAQLFFGSHPILILDEPTNHLDIYSIKWLEGYLRNYTGTLILTSHDRDFINQTCNHIADIDYGTIKIYKGNYDAFMQQKEEQKVQKEALLAKHDKKREDLQGFIDRFGAKATKARQAQSRAKMVEKIVDEMQDLQLLPSSRLYPRIQFKSVRPSGVTVLKAEGIHKSYGAKKVLSNVGFEMERGTRIAIIGPNGIGKSTLLEILTGHTPADEGVFNWGHAAIFSYFPQDHGREVKGEYNLLEWLGQFDRNKTEEQLRDQLGQVLFSGDVVKQSIHTLSGGEKARLILAKMMMNQGNVLVFDEPTNHLDIEAIDELTAALQKFEGTLLLVSHNRYFVSRLATRILEIDEKGVTDFDGTYDEFVAKKERDHLKAPSSIKSRYGDDKKSDKGLSSYDEQKKLRSLKAQLIKKMAQAEVACHSIEQEISSLDQRMAAAGFFEKTAPAEQALIMKKKHSLEEKLLLALENWESAGRELQECEEAKNG